MSTRKTSAHPHVSKCCRLLSSHLLRRITSRRKSLGRLREADYKKYEWLLEKLNLLYKPQPHDAPPGQLRERELVARKASIERLTDMWCDELRRHRWGTSIHTLCIVSKHWIGENPCISVIVFV